MRRRHLAAAPLCLLLAAAAPTPPGPIGLGDLPNVSAEERARSVRVEDPAWLRLSVSRDPVLRIRSVGTREEQEGQTVLTLATDVLFAADGTTLSDAARAEIARLVADVPEGSDVAVDGHTDTLRTFEDGRALSERQAAAVADAVRAARPDLSLRVSGYGGTQPVAEEAGPEARALDRRVEVRHRTITGATPRPVPTPEPVRSAPPRPAAPPRALPLPSEAVTAHEVRHPAARPARAEVVVGVEELVVRGAVTQLSLVVRIEGVAPDGEDAPDLSEALGIGTGSSDVGWYPVLIDRGGLLRYDDIGPRYSSDGWPGEGRPAGSRLSDPRRFTVTYPRLLGDPAEVDVVLGDGLPVITGVAVEVER